MPKTYTLRCTRDECRRPWAKIGRGVLVARTYNIQSRRTHENAISVEQLLVLMKQSVVMATNNGSAPPKPIRLYSHQHNETHEWATVANGCLTIQSRHEGHMHTNSISLANLINVLRASMVAIDPDDLRLLLHAVRIPNAAIQTADPQR